TSYVISQYTIPPGSGTKDVYVRVWDLAGNVSSTYKASIYLKDDNDAPKIELKINNDDAMTTNKNVILTINAYDDLSPIDQLQMRFSNDGINWTSWEPLAFIKNWTLTDGEGIKRVFMQVKDAVGNVATTGDTIGYYQSVESYLAATSGAEIDKTAPVIKSFKIANGASVIRTLPIILSIVATDNKGTNGLKMRFSTDGINWTSYVPYSMQYSLSGITLKTGYNILYIEVVDAAGNSDNDQLSFFYFP
ncbi:MAG: hypothetical protein ACPLSA_08040, partial [Caldanaerobacter sp.]